MRIRTQFENACFVSFALLFYWMFVHASVTAHPKISSSLLRFRDLRD